MLAALQKEMLDLSLHLARLGDLPIRKGVWGNENEQVAVARDVGQNGLRGKTGAALKRCSIKAGRTSYLGRRVQWKLRIRHLP